MNIAVAPNQRKSQTTSMDGYDSVEISGRTAPNSGQNYASIQMKAPREAKAPFDPDAGIFGTGLKSALNDLLGDL